MSLHEMGCEVILEHSIRVVKQYIFAMVVAAHLRPCKECCPNRRGTNTLVKCVFSFDKIEQFYCAKI